MYYFLVSASLLGEPTAKCEHSSEQYHADQVTVAVFSSTSGSGQTRESPKPSETQTQGQVYLATRQGQAYSPWYFLGCPSQLCV